MTREINVAGLPWFLGRVIVKHLTNEKCCADAVLLLADAIEEAAQDIPAASVYAAPITRTAADLRALAPEFVKP
jgi:hypothetical protein